MEFCQCNIINEENVSLGRKLLIENEISNDLAALFKLFGDPTRIKILHLLSITEMCVCDIASVLDMTQSAISHQLRVLKQGKLVRYRKDGKVVYYALDDEHVREMLTQGLNHITHE